MVDKFVFDDDDDDLTLDGRLPSKPILPVENAEDKSSDEVDTEENVPVEKPVKNGLPSLPPMVSGSRSGLPSMPAIKPQEAVEQDLSDAEQSSDVSVDKPVGNVTEASTASKPIPVDKPVSNLSKPNPNIPEDALYNPDTNEYFDAKTGYPINPKNGLLIVEDIDKVEVALPEPKVVEESRVLEGVDDAVDTLEEATLPSSPPALKAKVPDIIEVEDWTEDTSTDTSIGVGSERDPNFGKKVKLGKGFTIMDRDLVIMRFLARYRYAYPDQIARLVNAEVKDIKQRLKRLENEGLIRSETITAGQDVWVTRKAGNSIIDVDFAEIRKGGISLITIQHTIGLANLGVELEMASGGKNILGEDDFPKYNRFPFGIYQQGAAPSVIGEQTITEREIRRGNRLFRGNKTTEDMRYLAMAAYEDETAPELLEGNEGLFVVYGTGKDGEHVPDLVVARERDEYGKPQNIAIELELTPKNTSEWARIFRWYKDHGFMYDKIYYYTHKRTLAESLKRVAGNVGIDDRVVVKKYIPQNNRGPFWG